jgi:hypothetical protein
MVGKDIAAAVLLNNDDWGYGYFVLDKASLRVFEKNLANVCSKLNRCNIIG